MIHLWREPLVHFLLGGAALFLLYSVVAEEPASRRDRIAVGEERVASLAATFQRTWLRAPTRAELKRLVQDFVDEEILYREALELGLDRNDLVVRLPGLVACCSSILNLSDDAIGWARLNGRASR